jgi:hypothetical protein
MMLTNMVLYNIETRLGFINASAIKDGVYASEHIVMSSTFSNNNWIQYLKKKPIAPTQWTHAELVISWTYVDISNPKYVFKVGGLQLDTGFT